MPSRSSETPSNYAVLVEPTGWSGRYGELATTVWRALETLASAPAPPRPQVLCERFEVGPATIAASLTKPVARQIVAMLRAMEIDAKLTRTANPRPGSGPQPTVPAPAPAPAAAAAAPAPGAGPRRSSPPEAGSSEALRRRITQTRMPPREGAEPTRSLAAPPPAVASEPSAPLPDRRTPQRGGPVVGTSDAWPQVAIRQEGAAISLTPDANASPLPSLARHAETPRDQDALGDDASPALTQPEATPAEPVPAASPSRAPSAEPPSIIGWGQVVSSAPPDSAVPQSPSARSVPGRAIDDEAGGTSPNLAGNAWRAAGFTIRAPDDELDGLEELDAPEVTAPPGGPARRPLAGDRAQPSLSAGATADDEDESELAEAPPHRNGAAIAAPGTPAADNPLARLAAGRDEDAPSLAFADPPSVRAATWLGILAPGAGHTYLGDGEAGAAYAMSAPLLYPWLRSAREAAELARAQQSPRRRNPGGYRLARGVRHVLVFWVITAGIAVGAVALYLNLMKPSDSSSAIVAAASEDAGSGSHRGSETDAGQADRGEASADRGAADPAASGAEEGDSLLAEVEARRQRVEGQRLLLDARSTCRMGLYARCATLACRARELVPEDVPARRLCHEATVAAAMESEGQPVTHVFRWQREGSGEGSGDDDAPQPEEGAVTP